MMIGKTFISYRRDDDAGFAGRLYDRLRGTFGDSNVFFDVDNFPLGIDFVKELENQISICDVLLVIIGRDWLANGRLSKRNDFVRIEIELALEKKKLIIPVLVNNAGMPLPEQLPESIRPLAFRNAALLSHQSFKADSERILAALKVIFVEIENKAEEERKRAEAEKAEEERKRAEAERAEKERKRAEAERAEEERKRAEAEKAEKERKRAEAERAEKERKRAEAEKAEEERKRAEAEKAEEERKRAEAERAEEERKRAEAEKAEKERKRAEAEKAEKEARYCRVDNASTEISGNKLLLNVSARKKRWVLAGALLGLFVIGAGILLKPNVQTSAPDVDREILTTPKQAATANSEEIRRQSADSGSSERRAWLGVRILTVTDAIAESMGLSETGGALVSDVTLGGPADQASIQPGDVVLEFDGKKIDLMHSLPRIVAETPIGKAVEVLIWRRGEEQTVRFELGEQPNDDELAVDSEGSLGSSEGSSPIDALGLTVASLTDAIREQFDFPGETKGVVIVEIAEGSTASEENLRPGDVIVEVGQEEVNSPSEVATKVNGAIDEDKKSVLLLIDRGGDLRFVALRFASDSEEGSLGSSEGSSPIDALGLTVASLTDAIREQFDFPGETKGVVIVEIAEGSTASEENLRPGDVIVEVGQEEVNSPSEVATKVNGAIDEDKKSVLLLIDRGGDLRFVALRFAS